MLENDVLAHILGDPSVLDLCRFAPVSPERFRVDFMQVTAGLEGEACKRCAKMLLSGTDHPKHKIVAIATHRSTPVKLLQTRTQDEDPSMRIGVVLNPSRLADKQVSFVRV